jgi:hypothetical protein
VNPTDLCADIPPLRRAYIAASRRSDRSIEARLESARRASEIHKRRTGKALRVTEEDVRNEEMYEEEDDLPHGFAYGLTSSSLDFRMRMQAYWEQQFALRNAMSLAAAGNNLSNVATQPPLSLRDYYQRFARQYPLSLTTNQYVFPPPQIPTNVQPNTTMITPPAIVAPQSPSISSSHSSSPTKSPVTTGSTRRLSISSAPYSASNSQRSRRLSANPATAELPNLPSKTLVSMSVPLKNESLDTQTTIPSNDIFAMQPSIAPFTTQLPNHVQQFYLPDFVPTEMGFLPSQSIQVQSIPLDKIANEDPTDLFSVNDWTSFLSQPQAPAKTTPYEDGMNWEDYLDVGDTSWLMNPKQEPYES